MKTTLRTWLHKGTVHFKNKKAFYDSDSAFVFSIALVCDMGCHFQYYEAR